MKYTAFQKPASVVMFLILMVATVVLVQAQYPTSKPQTTTQTKKTATQTTERKDTAAQTTEQKTTPAAEGKKMGAPAAGRMTTATLTATLVDAEKKAAEKAATVQVKTTGVRLIDPAMAKEMPKAGQGHLHYQVDDGPVIATTTTKLSFHGLASGPHKIVVMLAGNDHNPLGPQQTLDVTIP